MSADACTFCGDYLDGETVPNSLGGERHAGCAEHEDDLRAEPDGNTGSAR